MSKSHKFKYRATWEPGKGTAKSVQRTPQSGHLSYTRKPTSSPELPKFLNRNFQPIPGPNYGVRSMPHFTRLAPQAVPTWAPVVQLGLQSRNTKTPRQGHEHCHKRAARRSTLFALDIAGANRTNSPGKGGTYHRTAESSKPC